MEIRSNTTSTFTCVIFLKQFGAYFIQNLNENPDVLLKVSTNFIFLHRGRHSQTEGRRTINVQYIALKSVTVTPVSNIIKAANALQRLAAFCLIRMPSEHLVIL
jgi:hypothetical protein